MKGKVAIVTGGASGIGLAIVESFAQVGVNCVIADMDVAGGERAAAKLQEAGTPCLFVATSVSQPDQVRHLVDATIEKFGRLDILVNNAGLQFVTPVVEFPEERWDTLIGVMLTGTFLCCKYALPHMIKQKWGRIINVNSLHGKVGSPFKVAYVSAKHGVLGLTKVVALEVAEHNITCNAICPAYVRTPLVEKQIENQARSHGISEEEVIQKIMLEPAAIKRLLDPSEVASLVRYLCSDDAAGITGAALDIDLGWTAH
ncbi:D-beta-hydroxybutyrate dehydrogenase [Candidatus Sulfotelmatomonas gaucii]|jgi:3-hydroxybutyrate dehydrogenase|uniref:D-beta-hydroxybutyrate dehydrogenase n=1 Tax=Candidatus Sulfuritelmatomonas gaucii TaxID=2043161 RepID=A0A2N9M044_9BACT|nr:D-beta-hydroxybutyrate dehydrogenase [Candidatus Sulfotelmatomonas gaucii]